MPVGRAHPDNNMETKTITTEIGKNKVVVKAWLTGRDVREIDSVRENGGKEAEIQDKAFELLIVEIDGKKEKLLDIVLDMHSKDYLQLVNVCTQIVLGEDFQKKSKKS